MLLCLLEDSKIQAQYDDMILKEMELRVRFGCEELSSGGLRSNLSITTFVHVFLGGGGGGVIHGI